MLLQQGTLYQADIELGFLEALATNDLVADKLRAVGFEGVTVTGTGNRRRATGRWPRASREVALPPQVKRVAARA